MFWSGGGEGLFVEVEWEGINKGEEFGIKN